MGLVRFFVLIVLLAPLLWGSVYPWTISLWLLALAFLAARLPGAWMRGPEIIEFSLYGVVLAFVLVVVLQIMPGALSLMPNSIWELSSEALQSDIPGRVAADLSALIRELGPAALLALALWTALMIGSSHRRATEFLQWSVWGNALLVAATMMLFFADERFLLWSRRVYDMEAFTHGFVNRNNAAAFLGTFMLLSFAMLARSVRNQHFTAGGLSPDIFDRFLPGLLKQTAPYAAAFTVFAVGLFLTGSRAGILLSGISLVFLMILLFVKAKTGKLIRALGIVAITAMSVWVYTNWGDRVSGRIDAQGLELGNRAEVYKATGRMISDYPLLGVGLGSFASTFPVYRPAAITHHRFYDRAHNTYLEIAAEMGLPFAILLGVFWVGVFVVLMRGFITRRRRYFYPAAGASAWLLASMHSFVDFPLQIPGHALVVAAIIGVCAAQGVRHKR